MDFFEAQARAKKRTARLVVLFALAIVGTILASYLAAVIGFGFASQRQHSRYRYADDTEVPVNAFSLWQPKLFVGITGAVLVVVAFASAGKWAQFSGGGGAVAESVGGRKIDPHTTDLREHRLLNVVEEMAIASGVPMPVVYVLDDEPAINAFAAGLTTSDAVVAVTRGTLEKLNRDELQAVIGHEFSHILNGDMRLNLRISALLFGILVLGLTGRGILWTLRGARFNSRDGKGSGGIVVAVLFIGLALLIIGYAGYFFGRLIQAGVSRQREFLADASSVQFTRNPAGLTNALKKIGGYALGSTLQTSKAAAIGHFFFAQSFRSGITGLWATHPPLEERIRAIDPQFDGKMFEPEEVVDVAHESFVSAGLAPAKPAAPTPPAPPFHAPAAIATAGTLAEENVAAAETLLANLPPALREAARSPATATALVFALLCERGGAVLAQQQTIVSTRYGTEFGARLDALLAASAGDLPTETKLPLLQLALPALRSLPAAETDRLIETVDALSKADGQISTFEFALKKILTRTLRVARNPSSAIVQIYSFNAVVAEISVVLSALAHVSSSDETAASAAFTAGANEIKLIASQLRYVPESACEFATLDAALDKLATASGPIKQRTLIAAAHVVSADGVVLVAEAELLRAIAATLDVPMPPLAV